MTKQIFSAIKVSALAITLSLGMSYVYAWTAPVISPPGGNAVAPVNLSATGQTKDGDLTVANLGLPLGGAILGGGSGSTYGATTVHGSKTGWSGVNFETSAGANSGTLMMHPSYSGFYNATDTGWRWYVDNVGTSTQSGYSRAKDFYSTASAVWLSDMQPMVTGTCSLGYAITAINADGTVTCSATGLGAGQTWQNKTSSRVKDTVYQNTTGRPIFVMISVLLVDGQALDLYVGNTSSTVTNEIGLASTVDPDYESESTISAVIPAGTYYKAVGETPTSWFELR